MTQIRNITARSWRTSTPTRVRAVRAPSRRPSRSCRSRAGTVASLGGMVPGVNACPGTCASRTVSRGRGEYSNAQGRFTALACSDHPRIGVRVARVRERKHDQEDSRGYRSGWHHGYGVRVASVGQHQAAPNWPERTCAAFATWERHPSLGRLETAVADSFHLKGRSYLAADLGQLWADSVSPRSNQQYVDIDRQYVDEDCHNGSGL